MKTCN